MHLPTFESQFSILKLFEHFCMSTRTIVANTMGLSLRQHLQTLQDEVRLLRESQRSSEEELRGLREAQRQTQEELSGADFLIIRASTFGQLDRESSLRIL